MEQEAQLGHVTIIQKCSFIILCSWNDKRICPSAALGNEKIQPHTSSKLQADDLVHTRATGKLPNRTVSWRHSTRFYNKIQHSRNVQFTLCKCATHRTPKKGIPPCQVYITILSNTYLCIKNNNIKFLIYTHTHTHTGFQYVESIFPC